MMLLSSGTICNHWAVLQDHAGPGNPTGSRRPQLHWQYSRMPLTGLKLIFNSAGLNPADRDSCVTTGGTIWVDWLPRLDCQSWLQPVYQHGGTKCTCAGLHTVWPVSGPTVSPRDRGLQPYRMQTAYF